MQAMPATLAMPCHTTFGHFGHHRSLHRLRPQVADPKLLIANLRETSCEMPLHVAF